MRSASTVLLLLGLLGTPPARAEDKPATSPTFTKDVAPIVFEQCAVCHRPGEAAPFALLSYQDVKKRGKLIAHVTQSRQMPPWKADKSDVAYRNERKLTGEQIDVLQRWYKGGMPEGDPALLPKLPTFADGWPLGKPDLVVKMPKAFKVPAEGRDIYRDFAVSLGLDEDKWVRAIDFRPSARSVVHHTLFFLDPTGTAAKKEADSGVVGFKGSMGGQGLLGRFSGRSGGVSGSSSSLGGWALGAQARSLPDGLAYRLPKGADLILSTHFHPSGKEEHEASTMAFYFADKAPTKRFTGVQLPVGFGALTGLNIAPGQKDYKIEDSFVLPVDVKAFGVSAHAHYLAKEFKVTATLPDGATKTLLWISDWDFAWQEQYRFANYLDLPKGTKLTVKISYDNSADNPHNPTKPPKRVRWGRESTDEMGSATVQVVAARETDFPKLQQAYAQHARESLAKSPLRHLFEKK